MDAPSRVAQGGEGQDPGGNIDQARGPPPEVQGDLGGGQDLQAEALDEAAVPVGVKGPARAVEADPAGGAAGRRGAAVHQVVAHQVETGAEAGEVVQPEDAPGEAGGPQEGLDGGGVMAEQAVQGEGPAAARGQGFRQGGADIRRGPGAEGLAAEGDTEKAAAVLAQGGPGVDRVQVRAGHAGGGDGGVR
ncbi:MAG: hypothetical protein ACK5YD_00680, partial [Phenylobacterium sp.]